MSNTVPRPSEPDHSDHHTTEATFDKSSDATWGLSLKLVLNAQLWSLLTLQHPKTIIDAVESMRIFPGCCTFICVIAGFWWGILKSKVRIRFLVWMKSNLNDLEEDLDQIKV